SNTARSRAALQRLYRDEVMADLAKLRPDGDAPDGRSTWLERARLEVGALVRDADGLDMEQDAPQLALQLDDYDTAVTLYERGFGAGGSIASYNLACAYARWSRESPRRGDAEFRRRKA